VGLEFEEESAGLAFAAVGINNGEAAFPGAFIKINEIRVNGEAIEVKKGYTSSDDGVVTRMNIYNEWVDKAPADARSFDGVTEDASPVIVAKEAFDAVKTVEVDFDLITVSDRAFLMFANGDWSVQYWGDPVDNLTAVEAKVEGEGTYTVGLEFPEASEGLAFMGVGVATGEQTFPGWFIDVKEVKVNGEAIELGKAYTSSDDGIVTRANLYNEWVSELPTDARRADGDLENASPVVVDKEIFTGVKTIEVTFDFIYGAPPAKEENAALTEEEIDAIRKAEYNAYIGIQTENYIFRNEWNEANYGRDSEANPGFFDRLTGWDSDSQAVDYGGEFVDALINANGEYTVSLTTGEKGLGEDTFLRLLFVSTDIPSRYIEEGILTISDAAVKFGDGRTQAFTEINTSGDYARITFVDEYNKVDGVSYTMPIGADYPIVATFTVSGMAQ
jgi:hypothetical protein